MKILFLNPNRTYLPGSKGPRLGLPLGLLYIAAVLEKHDWQPEIFDALMAQETEIKKNDTEIIHGVSDEVLKQVIKDKKPDIVGITNQFTAQIHNAIKAAEIIKKVNPKIITVVGGPHVSVLGEKLLTENNCFDYGVKGEGEYVFLELVEKITAGESVEKIKSLIYRRSGQVISNEFGGFIQNLDNLPYPAYHLIDLERYFNFFERGLKTRPGSMTRSISMITSRGCPYNCIFCSIHLHMGKLFRAHSAEYVVNHIKFVVEKYLVMHVSFEDDNFTLDINRAKKIFKGIIDKHLKITWDTPNGIRADIIDEELAGLMKQSGCVEVIFGLESGSQRVLDEIIDKKLDLAKAEDKIKIISKQGIRSKAFFVIGFPGETKEEINETKNLSLALYKNYGTESGLLIATPLIGTRLYELCKHDNLLVKEPDAKSLAIATQAYGEGLIKTSEFDPAYLKSVAESQVKEMARVRLRKKVFSLSGWLKGIEFILKNPVKALRFVRRVMT